MNANELLLLSNQFRLRKEELKDASFKARLAPKPDVESNAVIDLRASIMEDMEKVFYNASKRHAATFVQP